MGTVRVTEWFLTGCWALSAHSSRLLTRCQPPTDCLFTQPLLTFHSGYYYLHNNYNAQGQRSSKRTHLSATSPFSPSITSHATAHLHAHIPRYVGIHHGSSSTMEKYQADAATNGQIQPPAPLPNIRSRRAKIYKRTLNYCSTRLACAETSPRLHMPAHPQPQTADVSPARDPEPH